MDLISHLLQDVLLPDVLFRSLLGLHTMVNGRKLHHQDRQACVAQPFEVSDQVGKVIMDFDAHSRDHNIERHPAENITFGATGEDETVV